MRLVWFLGVFGLLFWSAPGQAVHVIGGEITYRCLGNGLFEFTATVIRDCGDPNSPGFLNGGVDLIGPSGTHGLTLVSAVDLSPRCSTNLSLSCNPPQQGTGQQGSLAKLMFRGNVNLSNLGPTPSNGYTFRVTLPCCRGANNNSLASNNSLALQVKMFPFTDPNSGQVLTPSQLCDASPVFVSEPAPVFVANPVDTIYYQALGLDIDAADSLSYRLDPSFSSTLIPYNFIAPYSLSQPIPGLFDSTFIPADQLPINPKSGELIFRPTTTGTFAFSLRITAFRTGQKIAEVLRETSFQVIPNPVGSPAPFSPTGTFSAFTQRAPVISPPAKELNGQGSFELSVYAGDTLILPIHVTDQFPTISGNALDPNTWVPVVQQIGLAVSGKQLSAQNSTLLGCDEPPCMTLRGAQDVAYPQAPQQQPSAQLRGNGLLAGYGYRGALGTGATLVWPTDCQSLLDSTASNGYRASRQVFLSLQAFDENCPIEGHTNRTLSLTLVPPPTPSAPVLQVVSRQNGRNRLEWTAIDTVNIDPIDTLNAPHLNMNLPADAAVALAKSVARRKRLLAGVRIFKGVQPNGYFEEVAFVPGFESTSWEDTSTLLGNFYYLVAVSNCFDTPSASSDTLSACQSNLQVQIQQGSSTRFCSGSSFQLQANYAGVLPVQWYRNNLLVPNATNTSLTVTQPGIYVMAVVDSTIDCVSYSNAFEASLFPPPFEEDGPCMVGVNLAGTHPTVYLQKTLGKNTAEHQIYRENPQTGSFEWVASIPLAGASEYHDQAVSAADRSHRYRIEVVDSCGFRSQPSETHATIHLQATPLNGQDVRLEWTPFEGTNFNGYRVFRMNGPIFIGLGFVNANTTHFDDLFAPAGSKVYVVMADLWQVCPANLAGQVHMLEGSRSNMVEIGAGASTSALENTMQIFPNPSQGVFQIVSPASMQQIRVFDAVGRLVSEVFPDASQFTVDLSDQSDGFYTLLIEQAGQVSRQKILLKR